MDNSFFFRYAEEQEIQTSLCSAKGVMALTIVTASILHTRWGALYLYLIFIFWLGNMLIFVDDLCRIFLLDLMCALNIHSVTAVGQKSLETAQV